MISLTFDAPAFLLLGLVALPLAVLAWRSLAGVDRVRKISIIGLRSLLLLALAVMLAQPTYRQEHDHLTVIGLLDVSGSVRRFAELPDTEEGRRSYVTYLREWFRDATGTRTPDDRFGLVIFDGEALAVVAPTTAETPYEALDVTSLPGTSIEDAIRLGLALFPPDTARRLVLVSDGNETIGDARAAAQQVAADGSRPVPIDVLPITYRVSSDVQIVRVETPSSGKAGQIATVRVMLDATRPTPGKLILRREGEAVDLDPDGPGRARAITVPAGRSVQFATVRLGAEPVNRFEAIFEPDDPDDDALPDNNRAESFTSTPGRGQILIVSEAQVTAQTHPFARRLAAADLPVVVAAPTAVPTNLLALQNYDLIVLDNVPAYALTALQQDRIARYVHDLGGGLIMLGGERSFGAGGWNGTPVETVLPLEMDPPPTYRLPRAALVLILDRSGSMAEPVAGARANKQQVANEAAVLAIRSLRAESLVGVVTFESGARTHVPLQVNDDPDAIAARVQTISPGGGTNIAPALERAMTMLDAADADRKRVVLLTDGRSEGPDPVPIAQAMVARDIKLSTIAIGDDADYDVLAELAKTGEGKFYPVLNPQALPRVLVDSVQSVNTPLIKEGRFRPVVLPTGSTLTAGMTNAPALSGLVVTAPRPDGRATIEMTHPDGEPLVAHGQAGLGRSAAFTSQYAGDWSEAWRGWAPGDAFWLQLARMTLRPGSDPNAELITLIENDRLEITLEASDPERGFVDYLQVDGTVYDPAGNAVPVRLRQTAPGRYEGSVDARQAGNYIVTLSPRRGARRLAPVIGGASRRVGEEFRRYQSDLELLTQIVDVTRGRRLDLAEPRSVDLYDRAGMPPSLSYLPIWRTLLVLVLGLFLLDVADRRLAWSGPAVRAALARARERVRPHARGDRAGATLATLRAASERTESRMRDGARGVAPLEKPKRATRPPVRPAVPSGDTEPDPSRVSAAIQSILGRGPKRRSTPESPPVEPPPEDADTNTSRESLLAAKRRARERMDRGDT